MGNKTSKNTALSIAAASGWYVGGPQLGVDQLLWLQSQPDGSFLVYMNLQKEYVLSVVSAGRTTDHVLEATAHGRVKLAGDGSDHADLHALLVHYQTPRPGPGSPLGVTLRSFADNAVCDPNYGALGAPAPQPGLVDYRDGSLSLTYEDLANFARTGSVNTSALPTTDPHVDNMYGNAGAAPTAAVDDADAPLPAVTATPMLPVVTKPSSYDNWSFPVPPKNPVTTSGPGQSSTAPATPAPPAAAEPESTPAPVSVVAPIEAPIVPPAAVVAPPEPEPEPAAVETELPAPVESTPVAVAAPAQPAAAVEKAEAEEEPMGFDASEITGFGDEPLGFGAAADDDVTGFGDEFKSMGGIYYEIPVVMAVPAPPSPTTIRKGDVHARARGRDLLIGKSEMSPLWLHSTLMTRSATEAIFADHGQLDDANCATDSLAELPGLFLIRERELKDPADPSKYALSVCFGRTMHNYLIDLVPPHRTYSMYGNQLLQTVASAPSLQHLVQQLAAAPPPYRLTVAVQIPPFRPDAEQGDGVFPDWLHFEATSRETVVDRLKEAHDGAFVVWPAPRESANVKPSYFLSVLWEKLVHHHVLCQTDDVYQWTLDGLRVEGRTLQMVIHNLTIFPPSFFLPHQLLTAVMRPPPYVSVPLPGVKLAALLPSAMSRAPSLRDWMSGAGPAGLARPSAQQQQQHALQVQQLRMLQLQNQQESTVGNMRGRVASVGQQQQERSYPSLSESAVFTAAKPVLSAGRTSVKSPPAISGSRFGSLPKGAQLTANVAHAPQNAFDEEEDSVPAAAVPRPRLQSTNGAMSPATAARSRLDVISKSSSTLAASPAGDGISRGASPRPVTPAKDVAAEAQSPPNIAATNPVATTDDAAVTNLVTTTEAGKGSSGSVAEA